MTTREDWDKYTKPSDETLLTACLRDLAMSNISDGDKAVVDAAIRVVKREAMLRERLEKLAASWRDPKHLFDRATYEYHADELSALLKEFP